MSHRYYDSPTRRSKGGLCQKCGSTLGAPLLHKEVTGVDADFNGSPLYYANNQLLTQAIEGVGSTDREAIAAHIKSHTYKTLLGEFDMRNQLLNRLYTVGQWQGPWFHAVGGVGYPDSDYVPVKLKTSWA